MHDRYDGKLKIQAAEHTDTVKDLTISAVLSTEVSSIAWQRYDPFTAAQFANSVAQRPERRRYLTSRGR